MNKKCLWSAILILPFFMSCDTEVPQEQTTLLTYTLENERVIDESCSFAVNETLFPAIGGGTSTASVDVPKAEEYRIAYDFGSGQIDDEALLYSLSLHRTQEPSDKPMVGYTTNANASLKYAFGYIRFPFKGSATLKSVTITSLDATLPLAGEARIPLRFFDAPQTSIYENPSSSVEIKFDNGLQLSSSDAAFVEIPAIQANYRGFNLMIVDSEGKVMTTSIESTVSVLRGETITVPEINYEPKSEALTFSCSLENDAFGTESIWQEGATVNVNGNLLVITDGAGTSVGSFGPYPEADSYVAVTPVSAYLDHSSSVSTISIPTSLKYGTPMMSANPMVAASSDEQLSFKYVSGVLAIRVSGENVISKAALSSASKPICGRTKVSFSGREIEEVFVMNDSSKEQTLDCGSGVSTSGGQTFYFVIPQGEYKDFKLTLTNTHGQMAVFDLSAVEIKRNTKTNLQETIEWSPSVDDSSDLSATGWANCYMLSSEGTYSFETRLVDGTKVGDIASADWLWAQDLESPAQNTLISDVSYRDGKITFKASGKEGNAVIAAFNEAGDILWSWHIWITDTPQILNYQNRSEKNPDLGYYAMDRNLGAISAEIDGGEATFGLFYQWGRKDPFVAGSSVEYDVDGNGNKTMYPMRNGAGTACNTKYAQAAWTAAEGDKTTGTKAYAAAHPMHFLAANKTSGDNNWLAKGIGEFLTDGDPNNGLWSPFTKTIYDPCPPGYMNPRNGMWRVLESSTDVIWHDAPSYGAVYTTPDGQQSWFPAQGYRSAHPQDGGALLNVGVEHSIIQLWTSELMVSYPSCRAYSFYMDSVLTNASAQDDAWGYGLNVRCVKVYEE